MSSSSLESAKKAAKLCKTITLNNKVEMPQFGLGTWLSATGKVEAAVYHAIKCGYRMIDCAWIYHNEAEVGKALKRAMKDFQLKREDLFITSKCWPSFYDDPSKCLDEILENLQLDYIDLYLLHWPNTLAQFKDGDDTYYDNAKVQIDLSTVWSKMEALAIKKVKVVSIGVSNFRLSDLEHILKTAKIVPAMNQMEGHPYLVREKLYQFCLSKGIQVTAYSPLGNPSWAGQKMIDAIPVMQHPTIVAMAKELNCTSAQICIAFAIARGQIVIPKSTTLARIEQNIMSLNIKLSSAQLEALKNLDINFHGCNPHWGTFFEDFPFLEKLEKDPSYKKVATTASTQTSTTS